MNRLSAFHPPQSHGIYIIVLVEYALEHSPFRWFVDFLRQTAYRVLVVEPQEWEEGRGQQVVELACRYWPNSQPKRLLAQVRPVPDLNPNNPLEPWK